MNFSASLRYSGGDGFSFLPCWLLLRFCFEEISNTFTPREDKLCDTEYSIPSIAVRIPTREVIPMATMRAVSIDRSKLACTDLIPSLIFSNRFMLNGVFV